ncbi:MAG: amidohydrolase [Gammaproteobacteria bacterium]
MIAVLTALVVACAGSPPKQKPDGDASAPPPAAPAGAFASTYRADVTESIVVRGATVLTGDGQRIEGGDVWLEGGAVKVVGKVDDAPGARVIDARGKWVTPGIIDAHSHLGVYPSPGVWATSNGNEATSPNTAEVWSEHSIWPQDPGFQIARENGGITTLLVLPGSANLIGGRGVALRNVPATTYQAMKYPGAPHVLKMACGENPRRVYGRDRKSPPSTNMANVAGYRAAFAKAKAYARKWKSWEGDRKGPPPDRDLQLETLAGVLNGEILVQNHCYRADEMATMLDVAREAGYKIHAFHHAVEAYKIANLLAQTDTCVATWADWWGFKLESFDGIRENAAMVHTARGTGCAVIHSDSAVGIQRLNQETAKAMAAGERAGLRIAPEQAIRWITSNPAKAMGLAARTGTLRAGLAADVVVWSGDPFSVYSRPDVVLIDGVVRFDRSKPRGEPESDFMLGLPGSQP